MSTQESSRLQRRLWIIRFAALAPIGIVLTALLGQMGLVESYLPQIGTAAVISVSALLILAPQWVLRAPEWETSMRLRENRVARRETRIAAFEELMQQQQTTLNGGQLHDFLDFRWADTFYWEGLQNKFMRFIYFEIETDNRYLFDVSFVDPHRLPCTLTMNGELVAQHIELVGTPHKGDISPPPSPVPPHIAMLVKGPIYFKALVSDALAAELMRLSEEKQQCAWELRPLWSVEIDAEQYPYRSEPLRTRRFEPSIPRPQTQD